MVEEIVSAPPAGEKITGSGLAGRSVPRRLAEIGDDAEERMPLPIGEFARVLGGGVVPGSVVLIGGDPGIGKSTLLLQTALEMARMDRILYVSGEESEKQIKMRALRLLRGDDQAAVDLPDDLFLVTETNMEVILDTSPPSSRACWWWIQSRRPPCPICLPQPVPSPRFVRAPRDCENWRSPPGFQSS